MKREVFVKMPHSIEVSKEEEDVLNVESGRKKQALFKETDKRRIRVLPPE